MHDQMRNSLNKFYPNSPFVKFGQQDIDNLPSPFRLGYWYTYFGKLLFEQYPNESITQIDSDCIVCNTLPEIMEGLYDVAAPLNNGVNAFSSSWRYISAINYLNIGTFTIKNKKFVDVWDESCRKELANCPYGEQDVFNQVFYSGDFKAVVLDDSHSSSYYGCSTLGRVSEFYLKGMNIMLGDKVVRVIHLAGPNKDKLRFLHHDVKEYIDYLIH